MSANACSENKFRCGNGVCIDGNRRCNNVVDCNDRSDELNCARNSTSSWFFQTILYALSTIWFLLYVRGFVILNSSFYMNWFLLVSVSLSLLNIGFIYDISAENIDYRSCDQSEFACFDESNQCLHHSAVCDHLVDCANGRDEEASICECTPDQVSRNR